VAEQSGYGFMRHGFYITGPELGCCERRQKQGTPIPLCRTLPLPELLKYPFVPVPRRSPETSACEVRKSVGDSFGVPRTLGVVAVVTGVARAEEA
jgi:hypothetical protein